MKNSVERLKALLLELSNNGHVSVSKTKGENTSSCFNRLEQSGIVRKHRQGSGNRFSLILPKQLSEYISNEFPQGLHTKIDESLSHRVAGVSAHSDSKAIKKLGFDILTLRGSSEVSVSNQIFPLGEYNEQAYLSLKISDKQKITLQKRLTTIITIENPTVFVEFEKVTEIHWDIAIYTGGKMSTLLLEQLEKWHTEGHQLVHFGDMDYVGLLEYARILEKCPEADIFIPRTLDKNLIKRFGKSELLSKQTDIHLTLINKFDTLPSSNQKTKLLELYHLIQSCSKGLEQEVFLIPHGQQS